MKLYLASFLQKNNFGSGRIISITSGSKPKDIEVQSIFEPFIPLPEIFNEYYKTKNADNFVSKYTAQLENFFLDVSNDAIEQKVSIISTLPFIDDDTLCSWERKENSNYRKLLAPFLTKMGYDVILN